MNKAIADMVHDNTKVTLIDIAKKKGIDLPRELELGSKKGVKEKIAKMIWAYDQMKHTKKKEEAKRENLPMDELIILGMEDERKAARGTVIASFNFQIHSANKQLDGLKLFVKSVGQAIKFTLLGDTRRLNAILHAQTEDEWAMEIGERRKTLQFNIISLPNALPKMKRILKDTYWAEIAAPTYQGEIINSTHFQIPEIAYILRNILPATSRVTILIDTQPISFNTETGTFQINENRGQERKEKRKKSRKDEPRTNKQTRKTRTDLPQPDNNTEQNLSEELQDMYDKLYAYEKDKTVFRKITRNVIRLALHPDRCGKSSKQTEIWVDQIKDITELAPTILSRFLKITTTLRLNNAACEFAFKYWDALIKAPTL